MTELVYTTPPVKIFSVLEFSLAVAGGGGVVHKVGGRW